MSDPIPSEADVRRSAFEHAENETRLQNLSSVGALRGIVETTVLLVLRVWRSFVTPAMRQIDRLSATGFWLRMHGLNAGLTPLEAQTARGILTATASSAGTLPTGTEVSAPGFPTFTVDGEVAYVDGQFSVPVTATSAGAAGNLPAGTSLSPPEGLDTLVAGDDWLTIPGADAEDDDALRTRIADRQESLGDGHPAAQYRLVSMSVPGIAECVVRRTPRGAGSADVIIRSVVGAPTAVQIDAVTAALDGHLMLGRDVLVLRPVAVTAAISVTYAGSATPDQVRQSVAQYLASLRIGAVLTEEGLYAGLRAADGFVVLSADLGATDRIDPGPYGVVAPTVTAEQVS